MFLKVLVSANAKKEDIVFLGDGSLKIFVKSPPQKGKANRDIIRILKEKMNFSKVIIKNGITSRRKVFCVEK